MDGWECETSWRTLPRPFCLTFNMHFNICVRTLHPPRVLCGLTRMIFLKVSWLLPNLEVCGERVNLGGFGESFYNVIACFYGNGNNLKVVFSSSVRGEVSTLRYLCLDGLTVSGTRLRRVRDVDMKRDFAFVVCISNIFSILSQFFSLMYCSQFASVPAKLCVLQV